jgi:opacity protein-like surface antigen
LISAVVVSGLCAASPAFAQESGFVQGFGGLRVQSQSSADTSLGGVVAGRLTPNVQIVGEAGRISNVLPTTLDTLLDFSPVGFNLSAWYGTAGVRLTTGALSAVRPYVETSAGMMRLHPDIQGLNFGGFDPISSIALSFLDRTDPVATVGGGVTFERGGFIADAGYRYRRIFSSSWVSALSLGDRLNTSEVRIGVGLRF